MFRPTPYIILQYFPGYVLLIINSLHLCLINSRLRFTYLNPMLCEMLLVFNLTVKQFLLYVVLWFLTFFLDYLIYLSVGSLGLLISDHILDFVCLELFQYVSLLLYQPWSGIVTIPLKISSSSSCRRREFFLFTIGTGLLIKDILIYKFISL